jgi:hypothetical protein
MQKYEKKKTKNSENCGPAQNAHWEVCGVVRPPHSSVYIT